MLERLGTYERVQLAFARKHDIAWYRKNAFEHVRTFSSSDISEEIFDMQNWSVLPLQTFSPITFSIIYASAWF
jgi:hypothetical protein